MNFDIALILIQDGVTSGAIYALLALAILLVFVVTRVLFLPQGEFVMYGAMTLASLNAGKLPGTVWLLLALGGAVVVMEIWTAASARRWRPVLRAAILGLGLPLVLLGVTVWLAPLKGPLLVQILLSLALVVPLGPMLYRVAFQPIANASILVLLFVAVAVDTALVGLGLVFFGAEGWRTPPFSDARFAVGPLVVSAQSLWVVGVSLSLMLLLWLFFTRTFLGKALRATAINRVGARLSGIPIEAAGKFAFTLAAFFGAFCGILIAPITTIYYDTGFLIGLKGFVATVIAGMVSYPLAAAGAVLVGILESFASFWASALKDAIVLMLLIPVLLWRSLAGGQTQNEDEG